MTFSRLCRYLQLNEEYGRVDLLVNCAGRHEQKLGQHKQAGGLDEDRLINPLSPLAVAQLERDAISR